MKGRQQLWWNHPPSTHTSLCTPTRSLMIDYKSRESAVRSLTKLIIIIYRNINKLSVRNSIMSCTLLSVNVRSESVGVKPGAIQFPHYELSRRVKNDSQLWWRLQHQQADCIIGIISQLFACQTVGMKLVIDLYVILKVELHKKKSFFYWSHQ